MEEGSELDSCDLALFLRQRLESFKVPRAYEAVDSIERTYNGKLNRKFYRRA